MTWSKQNVNENNKLGMSLAMGSTQPKIAKQHNFVFFAGKRLINLPSELQNVLSKLAISDLWPSMELVRFQNVRCESSKFRLNHTVCTNFELK
jgi:hypothetical protein